MREIKYRQAIYSKGIFHHWHYWGFIEQYGGMTFVGPETNMSSPGGAFENSYQYIGLLDRKKVEIYEGDRLQISLPGFGVEEKRVVKWDEERASYGTMLEEWHREVIGNICENPEFKELI